MNLKELIKQGYELEAKNEPCGLYPMTEDKYNFMRNNFKTMLKALEFYAGPDCGMEGQSIVKDGVKAREALKAFDDNE